jgi:hypothetical protein
MRQRRWRRSRTAKRAAFIIAARKPDIAGFDQLNVKAWLMGRIQIALKNSFRIRWARICYELENAIHWVCG